MTNRVYYLPPEVHRRLLILDPPRKDRRVAFTDLNEVRTFKQTDSPSAISGKSENELLKEHIRRLERRLERLSPAKENRQMQNLKPVVTNPIIPVPDQYFRPSTPRSGRSVTSPYRPVEDSVRDLLPAHPPANVRKALAATPASPVTPPPRPQPPVHTPEPAPVKPSFAKRFVLGLGVLSAMAVVPGFISIVALGPAGLGVAAACAALSAACIWIGNKMQ